MTAIYANKEIDEELEALGEEKAGAQGGVAPEVILRLLEESDLEFLESWEEDRFTLRKAARLWRYHVRDFRELDRAFDAVWAVVEKALLVKTKRKKKWGKTRYFCKQLVINLYLALLREQSVWVHRNRNRYAKRALNYWSYRIVVKVIGAMEETGIIYQSWDPLWSSDADGKGCWCTEYKIAYLGRKLLSENIRKHPCKIHRPVIGGPVQVQVRKQPATKKPATHPYAKGLAQELNALNKHLEQFNAVWNVPLDYLAKLDDRRLMGILTNISALIPAVLNHIQKVTRDTTTLLASGESGSPEPEQSVPSSSSPPLLSSTSKIAKGLSLEDYSLLGLVRWLQSQKGSRNVVQVPLDLSLYRVFSVNREEDRDDPLAWKNGRYVAEYQPIPEELRRCISVNGQLLQEQDFRGLFTHLAYHQRGITPPADARTIPCLAGLGERERKGLEKRSNLIVLGASNWDGSVAAVQERLNYTGIGKQVKGDQVVAEVEQANPSIADLFHRDLGVTLMRVESEIASEIMCRFMEMGLPILCVHDSFLSWDAELLRQEMDRAYFQRIGSHCPIH